MMQEVPARETHRLEVAATSTPERPEFAMITERVYQEVDMFSFEVLQERRQKLLAEVAEIDTLIAECVRLKEESYGKED